MADREWLENLKPGDEVVAKPLSAVRANSIERVERTTKTLIVLSTGERFRRQDGRSLHGTAWSRVYLSPPTPERVGEIRRAALVSRLRGYPWEGLPLAVLDNIRGILDQHETELEGGEG